MRVLSLLCKAATLFIFILFPAGSAGAQTSTIIDKTSALETTAAVCRALAIGAEQCAMITSVYSNSDQLWRIGPASQTSSGTLHGGSMVGVSKGFSCLRMHVRLADPQVIDVEMRVDSGDPDGRSGGAHANSMTFELFDGDGRFIERQVMEIAVGGGVVTRRAQYIRPAGEFELSWCEERNNFSGTSPAELPSLRFLTPRLAFVAPARLELARDGPGALIALTLSGVSDPQGGDLIVGRRPHELELNAALSGGAVFVDAAGNTLGTTATDTLSMTVGESAIPSFRMRATGAAAATLTLTFAAYGSTGAVAAVTLLPAELSSKAQICAALDIDAANCARFVNFSTSGGAGAVTAGIAGDDDALGWSVVEASAATGASALRSAALADAEHSCLGFEVHLDERESLAFDWRVSSRSGDVLRLWVDGETRSADAIEGEMNEWRMQVREDLAAGDHQIRWCYEKDAAAASGADAAWLDNVRMGPAKPILTLAYADGASPSPPSPFERAEVMLTLRLSDRFGEPLPLTDLPAAAFPLEVGVSAVGSERLPALFSRPLIIQSSKIVAGAMSYTFRLRAESLVTNNDAPWQVVVATAAGASPALTASLTLEPTPFAQYRQTFCDVVGLDEADCALIEDIHPSGYKSWLVQGAGEDRELVSASNIPDTSGSESCLNVRLNLRRPTIFAADMRVSSEPNNDYLIFRLNHAAEIRLISYSTAIDRDILIEEEINGQRAIAVGESGDDVRFTRRETLPAGESRVSWCYQKTGSSRSHDDAGYLLGLQFVKMNLALNAPAAVSLPVAAAEVTMSIRVTSDGGEAWPEDVVAALGAELQGDAVFVGDDGGDLGVVAGSAISIDSGVEAMTSLRVRLTSIHGARLLLTLAVDGAVTTATVNLRAGLVTQRALLRIDAPLELSATEAFEILDVPVSLHAFDDYGGAWAQALPATLTAKLVGAGAFIDGDGGAIGAITTSAVSISAGQTMTSLRARLSSASDARLLLTLMADGAVAVAEVSLRAAPRVFSALSIDAPLEVEVASSAPLDPVTIELSLRALDNFGEGWAERVSATLVAEFEAEAEAEFVGAAGNLRTMPISITAGRTTASLRVRWTSDVDVTLRLSLAAEGASSHVTINLRAVPGVFDLIGKTSTPETIAAVCRALELGDEQCAMITSVYSNSERLWRIGPLDLTRSGTLHGDSINEVGKNLSCLRMHMRLADAQVIDFEMRVDSGDPDGRSGPAHANSMTFELFDGDGRSIERQVMEIAVGDGVVTRRAQYIRPAGELELSWCEERNNFSGTSPAELASLRFFTPRFALAAPARLEPTRDGPGAPITLTLIAILDEDGEDLIVDRRSHELRLNAQLAGAAVFVDAAGNALGTIATDTLSMAVGDSAIPSFRMRATGASVATLTLTFTAYGSTGAVAAVTLLPSALPSKARICAALDIDAVNCARFVNFSTAGGAGGVTGGVAGDDDGLGWSVVETSTATGASALKSAALADAEHSCVGFDVHLDDSESLSFDWRVSARSGDVLRLWVDGETRPEDAIEGEMSQWRGHAREDLASGEHQIRWCYEKNATGSAGADAAWLDNVRIGPAKPILTLAYADGASSSPPAPFERAEVMLTLRLSDRFGDPLPLTNLPAAAFPLQVGVNTTGPERQSALFSRPTVINFSKIAVGATSYTFNLRAESLVTNIDAPWQVVVETAAGASPALAASLPLESTPFAQYRQAFCDVVGLDVADCALIEDIHSAGYRAWRVQGEGENRELASGLNIPDVSGSQSCLNVKLNFRRPTALVADMRVSSEPSNDYLIFRLNYAAEIPLSAHSLQIDRDILIEDEINGRRALAVGKSGDNVRFARREPLPVGASQVGWCYQKTGGGHLHDDAGYLLGLQFAEMNPTLNLPAAVSLPVGAADVTVPIRVTSDDGEFWPEDVVAAFGAELQGDAVFVGDDGGDLGVVTSATISIDSGVEAMMSLRVRLTSIRGARLLLTLAVDNVITTATVSLHAGIVTQRALLRIEAPLEVSSTEAFEILDLPVSLHAFDDYGGAWAQALPATLTAKLIGAGAFVDGDAEIGAIAISALSISAGQTTTSLRLRLTSAVDARLLLTLEADGETAAAEVSLRAAPSVFDALSIDVPPEVEAASTAPLEPVTIEVSLRALDNFGERWSESVSATLVAELAGEAEFVGGSGNRRTMPISIAAGRATTSLRVRWTSDVDATLRLSLTSESASSHVTIDLRAAPRIPAAVMLSSLSGAEIRQSILGEVVTASFTLSAVDNYGSDDVLPVTVALQALATRGSVARLRGAAAVSAASFEIAPSGSVVEVEVHVNDGLNTTLTLQIAHADLGALGAEVSIVAQPLLFTLDFSMNGVVGIEDSNVLWVLLEDVERFRGAYDFEDWISDPSERLALIAALDGAGLPIRHVRAADVADLAAKMILYAFGKNQGFSLDVDQNGETDRNDVHILIAVMLRREVLDLVFDDDGQVVEQSLFEVIVNRMIDQGVPLYAGSSIEALIVQQTYRTLAPVSVPAPVPVPPSDPQPQGSLPAERKE